MQPDKRVYVPIILKMRELSISGSMIVVIQKRQRSGAFRLDLTTCPTIRTTSQRSKTKILKSSRIKAMERGRTATAGRYGRRSQEEYAVKKKGVLSKVHLLIAVAFRFGYLPQVDFFIDDIVVTIA